MGGTMLGWTNGSCGAIGYPMGRASGGGEGPSGGGEGPSEDSGEGSPDDETLWDEGTPMERGPRGAAGIAPP